MAAFSHRISRRSRKIRPSHVVEWLIETDAITEGKNAIAQNAEVLEQKANDKWEGVTIHGQHKDRYGLSLKPELYRKLRAVASSVKTSASEVIEWTVREDGIKKMNKRLGQ